MAVRKYEFYVHVESSISHLFAVFTSEILFLPRANMQCSIYYIDILMMAFLTIF